MATTPSRNRAIFCLADVAAATKGALARGGKLLPLDGVTTDSRAVEAGNLFVALGGESFDGHAFVAAAAAAGARAAVVRRGFPAPELPADFGLVEVDDTLAALGGLALTHRRRFPELELAAIGGSNGKTTTKELTAAALQGAFGPTLRTEGNLNNEIGVPLTLLRLDASHRAAAVEMGMNHPGELTRLCRMAEPRAAIVTCAQAEHLEGLGSLEAVVEAEGELYDALPAGAVAVANLDDASMAGKARASRRRLVTYGTPADADVRLVRVVSHDRAGLAFEVSIHGGEPAFVRIPLIGVHNAANACGALATGLALGGDPSGLLEGLLGARGFPRRLELRPAPGDVTVIDDCYNANPPSAIAALETARALAGSGRVLAALGDMLELGAYEEQGHREVGEAAARVKVDALVAFGRRSRVLAAAAAHAGLAEGSILRTEDPAEARRFLRERARPGDVILAKASRGTRLERVIDPLVSGED